VDIIKSLKCFCFHHRPGPLGRPLPEIIIFRFLNDDMWVSLSLETLKKDKTEYNKDGLFHGIKAIDRSGYKTNTQMNSNSVLIHG